MSARTIAWIDGQWGSPAELSLPLEDRGLLLADGLFETVLLVDGQPQLFGAHLQRWQCSAALLEMAAPPAASTLRPLIEEAVQQADLQGGMGALRLNWSRGSSPGRGIAVASPPPPHRFWLQLTPQPPAFGAVTTIVSRQERRNSHSRLSQCKTFAYGQAIQARLEAQHANADEALLLGSSGELCCGATATVLVHRQGRWLTPPLSSGCLPGVMRGRMLDLGLASEMPLTPTPETGDRWLLINSLSCRPIASVDGTMLELHQDAEALWWSLLEG